MEFVQGQVVVHPHHGPCTVIGFVVRAQGDGTTRYVRLEAHKGNLVVGVPLGRSEQIGVRPLMGSDQLRDLFDVLRAPTDGEQEVWSRRVQDEWARAHHGDVCTVAGVVRDMTRRQVAKGLSLGEKEIFRTVRRSLVSEVALCLHISDEKAGEAVDQAVLAGSGSPGGAAPQLAATG